MGVYIKGMEIPVRCRACDMEVSYEYACYECTLLYKGFTNEVRDFGRLKNCPLTEIPQKHGDLIDRDELRPDIFRDWEDCGYNADDAYSERCIANAPVVIEAEVNEGAEKC